MKGFFKGSDQSEICKEEVVYYLLEEVVSHFSPGKAS